LPPQASSIILFHRLHAKGAKPHPFGLSVDAENFERWLIDCKASTQLCFVDELLKLGYPQKKVPGMAITFDDGYVDNYHELLPILRKHRVPVTIFLNSDWINNGKRRLCDRVLRLVELGHLPLEQASGVAWRIHHLNATEQTQLLERWGYPLEEEQVDHADRGLSCAEIRDMVDSSWIRFEAHGHAHLSYAFLSQEDIVSDLKTNLDAIESWTQRRPEVLAYPFGQEMNLSPELPRLCKELGLTHGLMASGHKNHVLTSHFHIDRRELSFSQANVPSAS
jgi:peptidoglycan/xylan/chitin deacetylase (PgdA/CDA1 family)